MYITIITKTGTIFCGELKGKIDIDEISGKQILRYNDMNLHATLEKSEVEKLRDYIITQIAEQSKQNVTNIVIDLRNESE